MIWYDVWYQIAKYRVLSWSPQHATSQSAARFLIPAQHTCPVPVNGIIHTPCPEKKHPEHYRLSLEKGIPNHNNFRYEYFCHSWPSNNRSIFHLTQCVSALPGESRTNKTWVKMNRNMPKSIRNTIDCDFKKNWQILIIFGANIFDITFHQMTDLVPTSPNVCFCTTWKNLKKGKR